MIIYGWGFFNRREQSVVRGGCSKCGCRGYMRSYTCSKFFTLYFVPVIPLGRHRVMSECPNCKQVMIMPHRTWRKASATDLPAAIAEYEKTPNSEEAAKRALGTIYSLNDKAGLNRVGPQIRAAFPRDANMLTLLACTYSHLCMDKEADALFLEAVSLSDDPDIAAEAERHISLQKQTLPAPHNRLLQSLPVLIVPALLLFGAAAYIQNAATAHPTHTWLVNGLSRPYTVTVNGTRTTLRPYETLATNLLVFGSNEIVPAPGNTWLPRQVFDIDVPLFDRTSGGPVIAVNPDRAAVILRERTGYSSGKVPDSAYNLSAVSGRVVHVLGRIDYPFREFPSSIRAPSSSGISYRTRVSTPENQSIQSVVGLLLANKLNDALPGYVRAKVEAGDGGTMAIYAAANWLPPDEFAELARPHLAERPVQIDWHRMYQTAVEGTPLGETLRADYRAMVEAEPENSALLYLLGRIEDDPDECMALFRRGVGAPDPSAYASFGLAYRFLVEGDRRRALEHCEAALRLEPSNDQFMGLRKTLLCGLGDFAQLEAESPKVKADASHSFVAFRDHLYRLGRLGRSEEARKAIPPFVDACNRASAMADESRESATRFLESGLALGAKDKAAFARMAAGDGSPEWRFQKALVEGNLGEALLIQGANGDSVDFSGQATLYCLLVRANRIEDASAELRRAAATLERGSYDQKRMAACLLGDTAPDPRLAAHMCYQPEEHPFFLAALAHRFPARADDYLARARGMLMVETGYTLALADILPVP